MIFTITKIKKKIRSILDVRFRAIAEQQRLNEQISLNYHQLSKLFPEESFIPFSTWAISPSTILHILNDISINKRKSIIEFGSGISTIYIAKLLKLLDTDAFFYSVESDKNWLEEIERQLATYKLQKYVHFIHSPLKEINCNLTYQSQETWYDTQILETALKDINSIDLILVDGPSGASTPYSRYSAIPFLKDRMTENCTIYLDDVQRVQEKEIATNWKEILDCNMDYIERYAVFYRNEKYEVLPFQLKNLAI